MFTHKKELQYHAKPERPDALMTRRLQEFLCGQWGRNVYYEYVPLPGLECSRE
ncbi:manganese catalase family protein [Alkalibacterium sp. s-m-28]